MRSWIHYDATVLSYDGHRFRARRDFGNHTVENLFTGKTTEVQKKVSDLFVQDHTASSWQG